MSKFLVLPVIDRPTYETEHAAILAAHKMAKDMPGNAYAVVEIKGEAKVMPAAVEYRRSDFSGDD